MCMCVLEYALVIASPDFDTDIILLCYQATYTVDLHSTLY
jgi:hypothetical protein